MKKCIINCEDKMIISELNKYGFECIPVIRSDRVSGPISCHSDVLYRRISDDAILISACQKQNLAVLQAVGYKVIINNDLQPGYKTECKLNFIINDKYIIRNPKTSLQINTNKIEIPVNQGYTSCSTLQVNSEAYITGDAGIYNQLINNKVDCLLIDDSEIELEGYNHGFIGGASMKLTEHEILFFGDFKNRETKEKINSFAAKYNISVNYINGKPITDIGSALII